MGIPKKGLAWAIATFVVCNAVLALAVGRSKRHQMVAKVEEASNEPTVLFAGNSLMEAGYRPEWLDDVRCLPNEGVHGLNLALGATTPVEHAILVERAFASRPKALGVVYGFFDDQLYGEPRFQRGDLVGNRAIVYAFPAEAAQLFEPDSLATRWTLQVEGALPMGAERGAVWSAVERGRRLLSGWGMPPEQKGAFGRVSDFAAFDTPREDFRKRVGAIVAERRAPHRAILELLQRRREWATELTFVEMPVGPHHQAHLYGSSEWQTLREYTRHWVEGAGATYWDAHDWVEGAGFEDSVHMNPSGATTFSHRMCEALRHGWPALHGGSTPINPPLGIGRRFAPRHGARER